MMRAISSASSAVARRIFIGAHLPETVMVRGHQS